MTKVIDWLLESDEPWTRYRTLLDLLDRPDGDPDVQAARAEMLAHPQVQEMIAEAAAWPGYPLKRHNDAAHPIYKFSTLADFGVRADDPGIAAGIEAVIAHQSPEGAFQTTMNIHERYGGTGEDMWTWMLCDAPTLAYALLAFGMGVDLGRVASWAPWWVRVDLAFQYHLLVEKIDVRSLRWGGLSGGLRYGGNLYHLSLACSVRF